MSNERKIGLPGRIGAALLNQPSRKPVRPVSDHRFAGGAQGQRADPANVIGVGDGDGGQAVKGPTRESPVEDRVSHGPAKRFSAACSDTHGRRLIVVGPFARLNWMLGESFTWFWKTSIEESD